MDNSDSDSDDCSIGTVEDTEDLGLSPTETWVTVPNPLHRLVEIMLREAEARRLTLNLEGMLLRQDSF